jgi:hypothetical protein
MSDMPAPAPVTEITKIDIIAKRKPLEIRLYNSENEPTVYTRSIVTWGVIKKAMRMSKRFTKPEDTNEEDLDSLSALIVEAFGDRFSMEDLDKGADVGEMISVMMNIVARAQQIMKEQSRANPTLPPGQEK